MRKYLVHVVSLATSSHCFRFHFPTVFRKSCPWDALDELSAYNLSGIYKIYSKKIEFKMSKWLGNSYIGSVQDISGRHKVLVSFKVLADSRTFYVDYVIESLRVCVQTGRISP